jgi:hypothetical protein
VHTKTAHPDTLGLPRSPRTGLCTTLRRLTGTARRLARAITLSSANEYIAVITCAGSGPGYDPAAVADDGGLWSLPRTEPTNDLTGSAGV